MKANSLVWLAIGLSLLALAARLVPLPRPNPRPDLPEIAPFSAEERIALFLNNPEDFPPPDSFGLVQRARAVGAEVRGFAPGDSMEEFAPTRIVQPLPFPETPTGYHPDQWPALPLNEQDPGNDWRLFILAPKEISVKNAAVLAAARALRAGDADDPAGTSEAALLSRARRAEIYRLLIP